ncbi:MAG TPA: PHB depolymerase family esterase [Spirochaetota bacterium]|nr:PHB depolymerase family esterase [Spirochaetota bacterium]
MAKMSCVKTICLIFFLTCGAACGSGSGTAQDSYNLRVPDSYDPDHTYPLIIAMHGYGDTNTNFESNSGLTTQANGAGFIIAYPQSRNRGWNAGGSGFAYLTDNADDVTYILNIIDEISSGYSVDANRVYLTGHSNGAFMAYYLAATVPLKFAAIAPVAGTMMMDDISASSPVSVIHIHGLGDTVVRYEGSNEFPPVRPVLALWREKDGCGSAVVTVSSEYTLRFWAGSYGDVCVYEVNGLGHTWPSFAANEIIRFFSSHHM